mgnify:CR=1 FL=1|nr:MAG TPA: DNA-directed RNA polymerase [Caudoviricetes sp.]
MRKSAIKIPTERKWYRCPYCGKKLLIFNDTAKCDGVFINCRECRREVKIKIQSTCEPLSRAIGKDDSIWQTAI